MYFWALHEPKKLVRVIKQTHKRDVWTLKVFKFGDYPNPKP